MKNKKIIWSPHRVLVGGGCIMLVVAVCFMVNTSSENEIEMAEVEESSSLDNKGGNPSYLQPMCNAQGVCGEDPSKPSPRTAFSSQSMAQEKDWFNFHDKLVKSSQAYKILSIGGGEGEEEDKVRVKRNVVFIGDSITESFLGTSYDEDTSPRLSGIKELFSDFCLKNRIHPLVLAISGDQTQHLLYRLQNGELSNQLKSDPEIIFVLHIGTNNLGSGFLPLETASGVIKVAEYLLTETKGKLLLVALLPRGDGEIKLAYLCPPRCDAQGHPFLSYLSPVRKVNELLTEWFNRQASSYEQDNGMKRVEIVSAWDLFINQKNEMVLDPHDQKYDIANEVDVSLMPDKLHPNAAGHSLFLNRVYTKLKEM